MDFLVVVGMLGVGVLQVLMVFLGMEPEAQAQQLQERAVVALQL